MISVPDRDWETTLAQKDIRFARTIQRLQRSVVAELEKIGIIHLYTLGYRGEDIISFNLSLNNPSKLAQIQELEFIRQKFEVAGAAQDTMFSRRWIAEHIFGMDNEEFLRNQRERYFDKKVDKSLEASAEELYYNVLNIDSNLFSWCRNMCKYGDYFLYLDVDEKMGITSAIGLPLREIERLEGEDKSNPNYIQYQWNNGGLTFENWQMAHFRVLGNDKYAGS